MRLNTTLSTLLLVFCWILCSTTAFAQATFRYSASGTDWQASGNWTLVSGTDDGDNGYPDGSDEALFDASSPTPSGALTNTPASVATVTLNGFTGTVQINSGFDLSVTNTTTINGGTLTLNTPETQHSLGVFLLSSGTFNGAGTVQMGATTVSGGTFNGNGGDYTIDENKQLAISGGTFNAGSGTYSLSITSTNTVFNHTGGTFNRGTSTFSVNVLGSGTRTATLSTNTTTGFHNLTITSNTSGTTRTVNFAGGGTFTIHNELERTGRLTNVTGTNLQYASGATLRYNPNNNQNVFGEWPSSSGPTNVIKQGSNTITDNADRQSHDSIGRSA